MKTLAIFMVLFGTAFPAFSRVTPREDFAPAFSTNTPILWQATTQLPKTLSIYKRILPHIFPEIVISNAIVLASLTKKGFPKPSTNDYFIPQERPPNYPGGIPCIFDIAPEDAILSYFAQYPDTNSSYTLDDDVLIKRARECAIKLGLDLTQLVTEKASFIYNSDENGNKLTNRICGRRVLLSRQLDGVVFYDHGDNGWGEGLVFELDDGGKVSSFFVDWPDLQQSEQHQTASVEQIIGLIRARKIIVLPNANEETYFQRVKALGSAKKFTITKMTPYYVDGILGETSRDNEPPQFASPIVELEAIADFGYASHLVPLLEDSISVIGSSYDIYAKLRSDSQNRFFGAGQDSAATQARVAGGV